MGTETLVEYMYIPKRAFNCRVWAILYGKMGVVSAPSHRESTNSLIVEF